MKETGSTSLKRIVAGPEVFWGGTGGVWVLGSGGEVLSEAGVAASLERRTRQQILQSAECS